LNKLHLHHLGKQLEVVDVDLWDVCCEVETSNSALTKRNNNGCIQLESKMVESESICEMRHSIKRQLKDNNLAQLPEG